MLANSSSEVRSGQLASDIHLPSTARLALLEFIAHELPAWRDYPDRPSESAETRLTEHLCDYLNHVAYRSTDWSHVQFRTETGDETHENRTIDLSAKPLASAVIIEGRRHSIFEALLPIECKRLPTPTGAGRDEREYVFSQHSSTGGIQRFKDGHHGASHNLGAIVGYIQKENCGYWNSQIAKWITELSESGQPGWSVGDLLQTELENIGQRMAILRSHHLRKGSLKKIELRHLWVELH